ncbi:MAG: hypothetical protein Q8P05_04315 [Candidatus Diapherotrites archaeon]|nr:hypothetical protein [Candidatus Diapherotrites archaeon]MDZ4256844.1 hypothetical protein [archaeon]
MPFVKRTRTPRKPRMTSSRERALLSRVELRHEKRVSELKDIRYAFDQKEEVRLARKRVWGILLGEEKASTIYAALVPLLGFKLDYLDAAYNHVVIALDNTERILRRKDVPPGLRRAIERHAETLRELQDRYLEDIAHFSNIQTLYKRTAKRVKEEGIDPQEVQKTFSLLQKETDYYYIL